MPSRATTYRRKNALLKKDSHTRTTYLSNTFKKDSGHIQNTDKICSRANEMRIINDESTMNTQGPDSEIKSNVIIDDYKTRRSSPTSHDVAVSTMIFKVRRSQNNRDVDHICRLLNALNVQKIPISMKSVEQKLHPKFILKKWYKSYYICAACGSSSVHFFKKCHKCNASYLIEFYTYSLQQQIQQLFLIDRFYKKLREEKMNNIRLFSNTAYGRILNEISETSYTITINCDGATTPNKNLSLWPFVLMLNEIAMPERRYLENVLIAGIIPTTKKPTNVIFETCLKLICDDLLDLQRGQWFYVNDLDQQTFISFYTIASCTDKPAEALMQNVVQYNSEYGCPKCFSQGRLYHGVRGTTGKQKTFTIRVYPSEDYKLRSQETCSKIIKDVYHIDGTGLKICDKTQVNHDGKARIEQTKHYGHLGHCPLTTLKYMDYGRSFLTDSLHTIYGGAFKRLMKLLFDRQYRKEDWSLFSKIDNIDELLSHIKVPSTSQRKFRSIKLLSKYKASEFRTLFHFGIPVMVRCIVKQSIKTLLLSFLTAINLASAEHVTDEEIDLVEKLLHYFVEQFQNVFGLRHMTSNVHSLLHIGESLKYIGPLWMYSTFNFEGIDKDLVSTVHGTVHFAKQLIHQHVLFRDAIVAHRHFSYPASLFKFNEQLLNRKQSLVSYKNIIDGCSLPRPVSSSLYGRSENDIATIAQSYFNDSISFFHSVKIANITLKTTAISYGKLFADNCVSFYFPDHQQKVGLIRAIVKSKEDNVRILLEELTEKRKDSSKMKFKINDEYIEIPNVFILHRSNIYHLKHPKWILKKHATIFRPGNCVMVLEYPNLKDSS